MPTNPDANYTMNTPPMPAHDFAKELEADLEANARMAEVLEMLADMRKQHPSNAQLAAHLIDAAGGDWRKAADVLIAMRDAVRVHLHVLTLTVALEGKERNQQNLTTPNKE